MSSSESEGTSLSGESVRTKTRSLRDAFFGYKSASVFSVLSELIFCTLMQRFKDQAEHGADSKQLPGNVGDHYGIAGLYWVVFFACLTARLVIILMWRCSPVRCRDSRYGALYMLFSSMQWVFYLFGYYRLQEEMTGITWVPRVEIEPSSTDLADGFITNIMKECLNAYGTEACRTRVNQQVVCKEAFDSTLCSGFVWIRDSKCCVRNVYSLERVRQFCPPTRLTCSSVFTILQWLSVLAIKWVYEYSPMLAGRATDFDTTIDILDAVLFAAYMLSDKVLYPKYGIQYSGSKGSPCPADDTVYRLLVCTWLVGITTAVLSPVIFTLCRPDRSEDPETQSSVRTYRDAIGDLLESTRMLQRRRVHQLADEAIQLQLEQYSSDAGGGSTEHAVMVLEADDAQSICTLTSNLYTQIRDAHVRVRYGVAQHSFGTTYRVKYSDGELPAEDEVDLSRLMPDMSEDSQKCGPGCFQGWCQSQRSAHDKFQARAEVCDAFRSLFCLELPFLIWRIYFEFQSLVLESWTVIVIAKNVVWGLHDLLVILTCNNPTATICGFAPLKELSMMIKGSAMGSVWVGPAGVFRIAADVAAASAKENIQAEKHALELHIAWLLIEREAFVEAAPEDHEALASFDRCVQALKAQLEKLDSKVALIHL